MNVTLEGKVMEKIETTNNGETKRKVRLYQKGVKNLIDVTVSDQSFANCKEEGPFKAKCTVGMYNMNGNVGMYAKENF